jgi:hypothetical protein
MYQTVGTETELHERHILCWQPSSCRRAEVMPHSVHLFSRTQMSQAPVQPRCRFCANFPSRRSWLPASRWALRSGSLACFKYIPTKRGRPAPGLLLRRSHRNQDIIERIRGIMEDAERRSVACAMTNAEYSCDVSDTNRNTGARRESDDAALLNRMPNKAACEMKNAPVL